jgi:hypothetical protein
MAKDHVEHEGRGTGQAEGGLEERGARSSATVNLARGGFESHTSSVPMTTHTISSRCGGLEEGNSGVDTSGWYEGKGEAHEDTEHEGV